MKTKVIIDLIVWVGMISYANAVCEGYFTFPFVAQLIPLVLMGAVSAWLMKRIGDEYVG